MSNYLGEWKVQIIQRPQYMTSRVYLMQFTKGCTTFVTHDGLAINVVEGSEYKDDDVWFAEMTSDQLQAFANSMASQGIKTTNDSKNEGLLEATKYHLEDMRKIAKLL